MDRNVLRGQRDGHAGMTRRYTRIRTGQVERQQTSCSFDSVALHSTRAIA